MQDIHGIRPPVPVGFDPVHLKILLMVLGGILLLVLLIFLIKKGLKKRKQPDRVEALLEPLNPYAAAVKELDLLFQRELVDPRLFYFDLTAVLRHYIGRTFDINAIEMTSQEFGRCVNSIALETPVKREIARFQNICDPIKYAGIDPEPERIKADFAWVKEMIDQIEEALKREKEAEAH